MLDLTAGTTALLVDGYGLETVGWAPSLSIAGDLTAGTASGQGGFVGWLDELKLFAYRPTAEVMCNHARGTLMSLTQASDQIWVDRADLYPTAVHDAIGAKLAASGHPGSPVGEYVCYVDYAEPLMAHPRWGQNAGLESIRDVLLFPEGPLEFDVERPDSSGNAFCLSCHHGSGLHGLGLPALDPGAAGVGLQNDVRRQPMMPPRVIFGNVGQDMFGPGLPAATLMTGSHAIDRYAFPTQP